MIDRPRFFSEPDHCRGMHDENPLKIVQNRAKSCVGSFGHAMGPSCEERLARFHLRVFAASRDIEQVAGC